MGNVFIINLTSNINWLNTSCLINPYSNMVYCWWEEYKPIILSDDKKNDYSFCFKDGNLYIDDKIVHNGDSIERNTDRIRVVFCKNENQLISLLIVIFTQEQQISFLEKKKLIKNH
jgi:hypothetical protein